MYVADRGLYFGDFHDLERQYGHRLSVSGAMDEGGLLVRGAATQLLADEDDMKKPIKKRWVGRESKDFRVMG